MPRRKKKKPVRQEREPEPESLEQAKAVIVLALLDGINKIQQLSLCVAFAILALCGGAVLRTLFSSHGKDQEIVAAIFFGLAVPYFSFYVTYHFGCRRRVPELESLVVGDRNEFKPHEVIHTTTYVSTDDRQFDQRLRTYVTARAQVGINVLGLVVFLPMVFYLLLFG